MSKSDTHKYIHTRVWAHTGSPLSKLLHKILIHMQPYSWIPDSNTTMYYNKKKCLEALVCYMAATFNINGLSQYLEILDRAGMKLKINI